MSDEFCVSTQNDTVLDYMNPKINNDYPLSGGKQCINLVVIKQMVHKRLGGQHWDEDQ